MLMWHIVLLPLAAVVLTALHVVLVRIKGVVPPFEDAATAQRCRNESRFRPDVDAPEWKGGYSPYDIIKEGTIAIVVILVLTLVLSVLFGSPDEKAITIKTWSNAAPVDFADDRTRRAQRHLDDRRLRCALQHRRRRASNSARSSSPSGWACASRSTPPRTSWSAR